MLKKNFDLNDATFLNADPIDNYFECISSCDITDGTCISKCVEILKDNDNQYVNCLINSLYLQA